jgi:hypothetical protein
MGPVGRAGRAVRPGRTAKTAEPRRLHLQPRPLERSAAEQRQVVGLGFVAGRAWVERGSRGSG